VRRLEEKILDFARSLRNHGVKVSLSQVLTALSAVAVIGFDREDFYCALESTLICERSDIPLFKKLFVVYFSPPGTENKPVERNNKGEADDNEDIDISSENTYAKMNYSNGFSEQINEDEKTKEMHDIPPVTLLSKAVRENDYPTLDYVAELGVRSLGGLKKEDVHRLDELVDNAEKAIGWFDVYYSLMPSF